MGEDKPVESSKFELSLYYNDENGLYYIMMNEMMNTNIIVAISQFIFIHTVERNWS